MHATVSDAIDSAPPSRRFWRFATAISAATLAAYFDLFLIGYVYSLLTKQWRLSFGQGSLVFLAVGIGAVVGSVAWGWAGDRFGRRRALLTALAICGVASGLTASIPDRSWPLLAALQLFVGAAVTGTNAMGIALVVELSPSQQRTTLSGLVGVTFAALGSVLAAVLTSTLGADVGWRGLMAVGCLPLALIPVVFALVPESPQWLMTIGARDRAQDTTRWLIDADVTLQTPDRPPERAPIAALYRNRRRFWLIVLTWLGVSTIFYAIQLWGPSLLRLLLGVSPIAGARWFILVSALGFLGRVLFSFAAGRYGRRRSGMVMAFGLSCALLASALLKADELGAVSLFVVLLCAVNLLANGGWVIVGPMPAELYGADLRSRAMGMAEVVNGLGKMAGPLLLGLIAGAGNLVTPRATADLLTPAFLTLAGCAAVVGLTFAVMPVETHGKSLSELSATPDRHASSSAPLISTDDLEVGHAPR